MNKILKHAKPYLPMISIAIVLLFVQANANLALPDYLSRIVNVGIQQGGIENAAPVGLTEQEMNRTLIFTTDANQSIILNDYSLITNSSPSYDNHLKKYPVLQNESIYVRNNLNSAEISKLSSIMARPLLIVFTIEKLMNNATLAEEMKIPFPPGTDWFIYIRMMPEANRTALINQINQYFKGFTSSLLTQAAIPAVKAEYEKLGMDTDALQTNYILRMSVYMLLLTLLSAACIIGVSYLASKTATGMARDMREDLFKKVESFSNAELDQFSTSSLVTRSTNDITQIQMVVMMTIRMVFYAPILGVGGIIHAMALASSMWWIIAVALAVLISLVIVVFVVALPKFRRIQKLIDRLNLISRENLSGMMVIRSFNMQNFEENRFDKANIDITKNSLFINRVIVILMPVMMLLLNGITIGIIWVGSHQIANGLMQVGNMMAFMQYAMQIVMSFLMISLMFIILPRASVSSKRISEVLNTKSSIKDPQWSSYFKEPFHGKIEFKNVSFRYPNAEEDALQNINFTALPGQTTALIGSTGAGKTTLVNLILRFYDVTKGSILIDGKDIREVSQHELRDKIGYVPQKSSLFSGTIASNLYFANENADEDVLNSAIEIAQVSQFVNSESEGMEIEIAQGGMNVSGGQKQRLSIARALVKQPPIYILDDSLSALDFKTESALRKAFKENTGESNLIVVTQRVSTVITAEQIIVLDEGRIVGKGTHSELMKNCETYKEIALSQHSMEELL
ncbi:MAG: ABC transporter ATP-binding protein [Candidatus Lokiarchaeota archaeon]